MNRAGLTLSAAMLLAAGCSGNQEAEPRPTTTIAKISAPVDLTGPFNEGLTLYKNIYGCPVEVSIIVDTIPNDHFAATGNAYSVASSNEPGKIVVNKELASKYAFDYNTKTTRGELDPVRIGVHESVHACQSEPKLPFEPVPLPNQPEKFIGVIGLTLISDKKLPNGSSNFKFSNIEEGAAEVIASELRAKDPRSLYAKYEAITRRLMENSAMTTEQLSRYIQNNDIYGFLSQVSGKPKPSPEDLLALVYLYN